MQKTKKLILLTLTLGLTFIMNGQNSELIHAKELREKISNINDSLQTHCLSGSFDKAEELSLSAKTQLKKEGLDMNILEPTASLKLNEHLSLFYFWESEISDYKRDRSKKELLLNKSLEFCSDNFISLLYRAEFHLQENKYEEALKDANRVIALDKLNCEAYVIRGKVEGVYNNFHKAVSNYTHALSIDPTHISSRINRASAYLALKEYEKSLYDLFECISSERYKSLTEIILADCYKSDPLIFNDIFQKEIKNNEKSEKSRTLLFTHLETMLMAKEYISALNDLEQLYSLGHQGEQDYYFGRSYIYNMMGSFDKAQENLNLLIETNSLSADAYILLGQIRYY